MTGKKIKKCIYIYQVIIAMLYIQEVVLSLYAHYERVTKDIHVRLKNMPVHDELRALRQIHLNQVKIYICLYVPMIGK